MTLMNRTVLVYEYFTGGGRPAGELTNELTTEGFGMLCALLADFRRWGGVRTVAALDARLWSGSVRRRQSLPADEVVRVAPGDCEQAFSSLVKRCDAVLIVAPETHGILAGLTAQAEAEGVAVLGSSSAAVQETGDKWRCYRLFTKAGLPTPRTIRTRADQAPMLAAKIGYPLVIKPVDGVGSEGVCRVDAPSELAGVLPMVCAAAGADDLLIQAFVSGVHASVSLMVAGNDSVLLGLNRQLMELGTRFQYLGSGAPLVHRAGTTAVSLARSAAALVGGLQGYVGIDLVIGEDDCQLIEINPRITTSYIALRQVARINLAEAIWDACCHGKLPDRVPLDGEVVVKKDDPTTWGSLQRWQGEGK